VELLVSIVVAGVALTGIYYYYAIVQQTMREQSRLSETQLEARLGMELLASDLQRAGYLATPNSRVDRMVCNPPGERRTTCSGGDAERERAGVPAERDGAERIGAERGGEHERDRTT